MANRSRSTKSGAADADPTTIYDPATSDLPGDYTDSIDPEQPVGDVNALFPNPPLETTPVEDFTAQPDGDAEDVDSELVVFPPTDPVITTDRHGNTQVLGGFEATSMMPEGVARSALDGEPGDEALADAIRRELREDASTTDLQVEVSVLQGVARLRGRVPGLEDADNVESVAGRVPGLRDVVEELEVAEL